MKLNDWRFLVSKDVANSSGIRRPLSRSKPKKEESCEYYKQRFFQKGYYNGILFPLFYDLETAWWWCWWVRLAGSSGINGGEPDVPAQAQLSRSCLAKLPTTMYKLLVRNFVALWVIECLSKISILTHLLQSLFVLVALAVCVFATEEKQDQETAEQFFLRYGYVITWVSFIKLKELARINDDNFVVQYPSWYSYGAVRAYAAPFAYSAVRALYTTWWWTSLSWQTVVWLRSILTLTTIPITASDTTTSIRRTTGVFLFPISTISLSSSPSW